MSRPVGFPLPSDLAGSALAPSLSPSPPPVVRTGLAIDAAMPSVALDDVPGGASYAPGFVPPTDRPPSSLSKLTNESACLPSLADSILPSTPSKTSSVVTNSGSSVAVVVTPGSGNIAGVSPPASSTPSASTASAVLAAHAPMLPGAASSIKRAMDEVSTNMSPTKAIKKAKGSHVLNDFDLKSVSSFEQSYREIFGAYASLPASPVDQLNDILHCFTVDTVKEWAASATGQA